MTQAARAFALRIPTFMASAEWCTYLEDMPHRAYGDRLWPVVLKIPGLMRQVDVLAVTGSSLPECLMLLEQIDKVDLFLDSWLDAYEQDVSDKSSTYWFDTSPPRAVEARNAPAIDFDNISIAEVMMTYWAYKLEMSVLLEQVDALNVTTVDSQSLATISRSGSHKFASLIGRSIAYWLRHVSAEVCLFRLLYAVRVAWEWFARLPKVYDLEIRACRTFRTKMQSESKTRMAEFVMDLFYKPPPDEAL